MSAPTEIQRVAQQLERALATHGYTARKIFGTRLIRPCTDAKAVGEHARWMLQELLVFPNQARAMRWLRFAEGLCWSLGVRSILEITELHDDKGESW